MFPSPPSVGMDGTGYKANGHSNTGPITQAQETSPPFTSLPLQQVAPAGLAPQQAGHQHPKQAQAEEGVLKGGVGRGGFLPYHNSSLLSSSRLHVTTNYTLQPEDNIYLLQLEFLACLGKDLNPVLLPALPWRVQVKKTQPSHPWHLTQPVPSPGYPPSPPWSHLYGRSQTLSPSEASPCFSEVPTPTGCWHTDGVQAAE